MISSKARMLAGIALFALATPACAQTAGLTPTPPLEAISVTSSDGAAIRATPLEMFANPWAMTFLPDGRSLVTEKEGAIWLLGADGRKVGALTNTPAVTAIGQGGLGDIVLHPDFATNGIVYVSYVERDPANDELSGAAVERAKLTLSASGGTLSERRVIWRQSPKTEGNGHYGHRLAISPDRHLFITSGERQKFFPAQNMAMNLGKVIRLNLDGTTPEDNPFHGNGSAADQVWTFGHRNPLGIDFDAEGRLWVHEMGPRGGDELNLIIRSRNYGYPEVSEGTHYDGTPIPAHSEKPTYEAPKAFWVPAISPAGFVIYDGKRFADWTGDGLLGGLSSQALIRVEFQQSSDDAQPSVKEVARYDWDTRIREVEQGPDGALYVLEDGEEGRLVRLEPSN